MAVVAILCVLDQRRRSFATRAAYHESRMVATMYPRSPVKGLPMGLGVRGPDITAERLAHSLAEPGKRVHLLRSRQEPHDGGRREDRHLARGDGPKVPGGQPLPLVPRHARPANAFQAAQSARVSSPRIVTTRSECRRCDILG